MNGRREGKKNQRYRRGGEEKSDGFNCIRGTRGSLLLREFSFCLYRLLRPRASARLSVALLSRAVAAAAARKPEIYARNYKLFLAGRDFGVNAVGD